MRKDINYQGSKTHGRSSFHEKAVWRTTHMSPAHQRTLLLPQNETTGGCVVGKIRTDKNFHAVSAHRDPLKPSAGPARKSNMHQGMQRRLKVQLFSFTYDYLTTACASLSMSGQLLSANHINVT